MRWLIFGFALLGAMSFSWAQPTQVPEALRPYIGKPIPDATLIDADGKKLKISDFRGKVLLLNFWSPY